MDAALLQLSDALEALTPRSTSNITIASSHDIASMWLIPRLNRFRSKHPGVEIRLIVGDDYTQFDKDDVDVSLRFGKGEWSGWQSVRLFDEEVYAVCAPALIARHRELRLLQSPSDILAAPLIHITPSRGVDWYYWFKALGSRVPRSAGGVNWSDSGLGALKVTILSTFFTARPRDPKYNRSSIFSTRCQQMGQAALSAENQNERNVLRFARIRAFLYLRVNASKLSGCAQTMFIRLNEFAI